jgi:hypothetical protein
MTDHRKVMVQASYDAMAERYLAWSRSVVGDPRAVRASRSIRTTPPIGELSPLSHSSPLARRA